jgi:hypothetical protein
MFYHVYTWWLTKAPIRIVMTYIEMTARGFLAVSSRRRGVREMGGELSILGSCSSEVALLVGGKFVYDHACRVVCSLGLLDVFCMHKTRSFIRLDKLFIGVHISTALCVWLCQTESRPTKPCFNDASKDRCFLYELGPKLDVTSRSSPSNPGGPFRRARFDPVAPATD